MYNSISQVEYESPQNKVHSPYTGGGLPKKQFMINNFHIYHIFHGSIVPCDVTAPSTFPVTFGY